MDSTSEFGALIIKAGAGGDLKKLKEIRKRVGDDTEFRRLCDLHSDFSTGRSVLHHAAEMGHLEICRFLIKNVKVYSNALTYRRDTPLIEAVRREHVKLVDYLINQGASISSANSNGYTALHYAVLKDNWELTELLVIKGARVNADSVKGTPLQIAISCRNVEAVKFLLSRGAKPNLSFLVMENPLICAIKAHAFECMDALLKAQADPNRFFVGFCPLSYAAKEGDTKYLKTLLAAGADPNASMMGPLRIMEDAALAHNREGVEILIPLTQPIKHYPEWTVDGIIDYCHSKEAKIEREEDKGHSLAALDMAGHVSLDLKDHFSQAVVQFKLANILDPSNPKWASKRSLCHAHADRRVLALYDAEECIRLEPRFPDPHPGEDTDAAAQIFKKFFMASLAFTLDPHNEKADDAFRAAFFDYFAWLYLMSSPKEIASFTRKS